MLQDLPDWLSTFIMAQLGQRSDLSVVSPAAEATMRVIAFWRYRNTEFGSSEIQAQHSVLKALAFEDKILVAATFMLTLATRLEGFTLKLTQVELNGTVQRPIKKPSAQLTY